MAINWGGGLMGAASGMALGSFGGPLGMGIGAVGGGLLGMFGGSGGGMQQVNPYADDYWDLMTGNMRNYQAKMGQAEGMQTAYLGAGERSLSQLAGFRPEATYDPQASIRAFNAQLPFMQRQAQGLMSPFGDAQGTSVDRAQRAGQEIAANYNQMGALNTGAASRAIGEGATRAAGEMNLQQDQLYQNFLMNMMNPRLQILQQAYQTELQRQMAEDEIRRQNIAAEAQGYMNIAGVYGQRAGQYAGLAGGAQSGLAAMAGQEYAYTPPSNPFLEGLQGAAGIMTQMNAAGMFPSGGWNWNRTTPVMTDPGIRREELQYLLMFGHDYNMEDINGYNTTFPRATE